MVATRKLQIEIERTLKKVQQALDDFRATWGKMDDASEVLPRSKTNRGLHSVSTATDDTSIKFACRVRRKISAKEN